MKWLCCTAAMLVREDGDDVDISAIEQFAAIFEHFDGAFSDWRGPFSESSFASFFDVVAIDVADGGAVAEVHGLGPDGNPAIAGADAAEHGAVIGAAEGCGRGRVCKPVRRGRRGQRSETGGLEKTAAGGGIGSAPWCRQVF
ncbi:MAG: hypothetical protein ACK45A_04295 [Planctomyces sp.]